MIEDKYKKFYMTFDKRFKNDKNLILYKDATSKVYADVNKK